ncbi:alpha/beta hydrolase [Rhizobium sp. CNPSo 3464]|nr:MULTISPECIES: alpha/beta hydrolase [Rhizobium]MDK4741654.1 alpha/beta hydrolase [Rhizobium sp. CNPSo 3464]
MAIFNELRSRMSEALGDQELPRLTPDLTIKIAFYVGDQVIALDFAEGGAEISGESSDPQVTVRATTDAWDQVLMTPPPATFHSFTALQLANPLFEIAGSPLDLAKARPALERVFELVVTSPEMTAERAQRDLRQIRGRYAVVNIDDVPHEIYYEEAGEGVPVLFLHTAGADSRQFMPQLADTELAKSYRLIAVDLPFHGRSMPPLTWDGAPYKLTASIYLKWCTAILEQVVREKAIVAGGSMGAAMSLVLAAERPEHILGIVAIEPPFRSKGRRNPYQHNVNVHGSLHNSAYVRGIMSPLSPAGERRRSSWIYSQGAPGVYPGDLSFYSDEFDGAVTAPRIDPSRTPVALLSGDYDYSATPADGAKLAELIPGCLHLVMGGLGHFPMCEHPNFFRSYLVKGLDFVRHAAR